VTRETNVGDVIGDVVRMRREIEKLTGRLPASTSTKYLAARLADLRRAKAISISMPAAAHAAVAAAADRCGISISELVRDSLVDHLRRIPCGDAEANIIAACVLREETSR